MLGNKCCRTRHEEKPCTGCGVDVYHFSHQSQEGAMCCQCWANRMGVRK